MWPVLSGDEVYFHCNLCHKICRIRFIKDDSSRVECRVLHAACLTLSNVSRISLARAAAKLDFL